MSNRRGRRVALGVVGAGLAAVALGFVACASGQPEAPPAQEPPAAPQPPATFRFNDGGTAEIQLSAAFSARLRELRASRGQAWQGTGGLRAAPLGFFRLDGEELAYYGFMTSKTRRWSDPSLEAFWKVVTTQPEEELTTFAP